jgi:hypothetical protein
MENKLFEAIMDKIQYQHKLRKSRVRMNAKNTTNDIMKNLFDDKLEEDEREMTEQSKKEDTVASGGTMSSRSPNFNRDRFFSIVDNSSVLQFMQIKEAGGCSGCTSQRDSQQSERARQGEAGH